MRHLLRKSAVQYVSIVDIGLIIGYALAANGTLNKPLPPGEVTRERVTERVPSHPPSTGALPK